MKTIRCILIMMSMLALSAQSFAQAPQKFNYQAVCRDNAGNVISNSMINIRIKIHDTTSTGTIVYQELHPGIATNQFGLVNLQIGSGTVQTGTFDSIKWESGDKYLQIEFDQGSGYITVGNTQLLSVPYSLYAENGQTKHYVGESYGGGIVFYVTADGQHGLIAATTDQSTGIQWYNGTYTTTNAARDGIGAGMYNTERVIANQGAGNFAAQLCANYQGGNYGDWYLPSLHELILLYAQQAIVGGFAGAFYWSSTESDTWVARVNDFSNGIPAGYSKNGACHVRAIRSF